MLGLRSAAPVRGAFSSLASIFATASSSAARAASVVSTPERSYLSLIQGNMTLGNMRDIPGSSRLGKRVGRGRSSGLGKTSGRGQKGQGSRSGLRDLIRYEGGQTMLWRRSPKHGFSNAMFRKELDVVNVRDVVESIAAGRIDASKTITMKALADAGLASSVRHGIKLCGRDASYVSRLPVPINIEVTHSSALARDAIEEFGGSVKFVYHSRLALHALLHPGTRTFIPGPSVPPPKLALRYSHQICGKRDAEKARELRLARIVRRIRSKK
jgi:large subunit ribosomal protein L15